MTTKNSNGPFYHCSDHEFQEGDKLKPMLRKSMESWGTYDRFVEQVFEDIRKSEFPDRPSRLESVFVTPDKSQYSFLPNCYEVKFSERGFLTDQDIYSEASITRQWKPAVEDHARKYWVGSDNPRTPELLIKGSAVIINTVQKD